MRGRDVRADGHGHRNSNENVEASDLSIDIWQDNSEMNDSISSIMLRSTESGSCDGLFVLT